MHKQELEEKEALLAKKAQEYEELTSKMNQNNEQLQSLKEKWQTRSLTLATDVQALNAQIEVSLIRSKCSVEKFS